MKVYTALLAFGVDQQDAALLTDSSGNAPSVLLNDKSGETLDLVRDTLYNISGVSSNFYGHFDQAGFYEITHDNVKSIYLIYSVYFPSVFDLVNQSFRWTKLCDLDENGSLYNAIRFIYGSRR